MNGGEGLELNDRCCTLKNLKTPSIGIFLLFFCCEKVYEFVDPVDAQDTINRRDSGLISSMPIKVCIRRQDDASFPRNKRFKSAEGIGRDNGVSSGELSLSKPPPSSLKKEKLPSIVYNSDNSLETRQ